MLRQSGAMALCAVLCSTYSGVPAAAQDPNVRPDDTGRALIKAAYAVSATKCAAAYADLGSGLTSGARTALTTMRGSSAATAQTISGIAGLTYAEPGITAAAGTIFVTPTATGCQGQITRVVTFARTCDEMDRKVAATPAPPVKLEGVAVRNLPQGQAIFVPGSAGSCTVVTTITALKPG